MSMGKKHGKQASNCRLSPDSLSPVALNAVIMLYDRCGWNTWSVIGSMILSDVQHVALVRRLTKAYE